MGSKEKTRIYPIIVQYQQGIYLAEKEKSPEDLPRGLIYIRYLRCRKKCEQNVNKAERAKKIT